MRGLVDRGATRSQARHARVERRGWLRSAGEADEERYAPRHEADRGSCARRRGKRGHRRPHEPSPRRRRLRLRGRDTARTRIAKRLRPVADAAVAARGDVQVAPPGSLERSGRGPRLTAGAKRLELGVNPVARPVTLAPAFPGEAVPGRASAPDAPQDSGLDELRQVICGLRTADPRELFVLATAQLLAAARRCQRGQRSLLRALQLGSPNGGIFRHGSPPPTARPVNARYRTFAESGATFSDSGEKPAAISVTNPGCGSANRSPSDCKHLVAA